MPIDLPSLKRKISQKLGDTSRVDAFFEEHPLDEGAEFPQPKSQKAPSFLTGILAFGHGGGVPGPLPGGGGNAGNTNFAIIPNLPAGQYKAGSMYHFPKHTHKFTELLKNPYYLLDCGPETALQICGVLGSEPTSQNLVGVFLTHAHDDHSGGLKSLGYRTKYIDGTKPKLFMHADLKSMLYAQMGEMDFHNPTLTAPSKGEYFTFASVNDPVQIPGARVNLFPVNHNCFSENHYPMPAFGWVLTTESGTSVVFSGDTAFPIYAEHANATWMIHDAQFYNDGSRGDHVHCPYSALRDAVPVEERHKVLLTHTGRALPKEAEKDGFSLFAGGMLLVV